MRYALMSRFNDRGFWNDVGYADTVAQAKKLAQCWTLKYRIGTLEYRIADMAKGLVADLNVTPRSCTLAGKWRKA